ncbi:hypothetical protein [Roseisolibacter sp. H3M3-2]|uniref:hypothetical protein n=1 Tax=Roseisolibacter sp. H3M3-2 TaxID=3031323 RepID=UPI0023DBDBC5|nr:hypothetical protein [Roseisolibacter sp. H3M3-2]MDF1504764.1 hypothetical protein [Roseisolibacter sp. H3M3-2]
MELLLALWIALVQALTPAHAPSASVRLEAAADRGATAFLRAERVAGTTAVTRVAEPTPVDGNSASPALDGRRSAPIGASAAARVALRRLGGPSHAPAAAGGVRPYFPTAPPLQG